MLRMSCSYKWKFQVYNAVIVAQLTCGLSIVQLMLAVSNKMDAFRKSGLRYIFKLEHSYFSYVSNEEVYAQINFILISGDDLNITWQENSKNQRMHHVPAKHNFWARHTKRPTRPHANHNLLKPAHAGRLHQKRWTAACRLDKRKCASLLRERTSRWELRSRKLSALDLGDELGNSTEIQGTQI